MKNLISLTAQQLTQIVDNTPAVRYKDDTIVGGIGGSMIPGTQVTAGGFYKCTSVDTDTQKWTGHRVTFTSDSCTYASDSTELKFQYAIPEVGKTYSPCCRYGLASDVQPITPVIPSSIYASLNPLTADLQQGGSWSMKQGVSQLIYKGIPCSYFAGDMQPLYADASSCALSILRLGTEYSRQSFAVSFWAAGNGTPLYIGPVRNTVQSNILLIALQQGAAVFNLSGTEIDVPVNNTSVWHHYGITCRSDPTNQFGNNYVSIYVDGVLSIDEAMPWSVTPERMCLGYMATDGISYNYSSLEGYMAALRIDSSSSWKTDYTSYMLERASQFSPQT